MNRDAKEGQIFICACCGKRSMDLYGDKAIDSGWDESCIMNAVLCYAEKKFDEHGVLGWEAIPNDANVQN